MTRQGAPPRARSWHWLAPALLMACTTARSVSLTPAATDAGVTDAGMFAVDSAGVTDAGVFAVDGAATQDAKRDGSAVVEVGSADTGCGPDAHLCGDGGFQCSDGFHSCGGLCVSNNSVLTCGSSCAACPVPTIGNASCDGSACGVTLPTFNLSVSPAGVAGATGTVAVSPTGTSCGAGCFTYNQGTSVMITEAPTGTATFTAWSGDCTGQGATCTLTMSSNRAAVAHFRPNLNIVFVSEGKITGGAIGSSLATADAFCASSAKAAFLGGTVWKAWLSTSSATTNINAATHIGASTTGWIRVDGRPFVTSIANLLAGKMYYPVLLTELGNQPLGFVMTGTNPDGSPVTGANCADWTSSTGSVYCGVNEATVTGWTFDLAASGDACGSTPLPIYCFESDTGMASVPTLVAPASGRHAFLSTTTWTPGGGVTAADTVCQADAGAAGLANPLNYRAMLTTTVPATDSTRISTSGQPWYRLDGAQLVAAAADIADPTGSKTLCSLSVSSTGVYVNSGAWTGSGVAASSTAMTQNCNNWTSSSTSVLGWSGSTNSALQYWWAGAANLPCGNASHLYCFEK